MSRKVVEVGAGDSNTSAAVERRLGRTAPPLPPPDPSSISQECLSIAEEAGEQVLNYVHPTLDSEEKRTMVVDYVQHLVKTHLNCEVVSYGSVPLKTYLPDGDIDLTVIKGGKAEESLAREVLALLQGEEQDENSEYEVKDTQFIDAEVKLVKCLVRGTVIDISFNQLGGLSTLCFLEQVDRRVGRNHLFKRSIILVKTWCYYESRILGAHHGLISTYALETLILYIFQIFHSSLNGPLSVLYRFLDYYSQFDWENYCISLKGPVYKMSLPEIVVKIPEKGWEDLLLNEDFLEKSLEMYSVSPRGLESCQKTFQIKHLNIIDPLKDYNNLGRSVNKGNFYRIKSALKYGARKLGQILLQPKDKVAADELCKFFPNTCARHENDYRNRLRHFVLEFDIEDSLTASLSSPDDLSSEFDLPLKSSDSDFDNNSVGVGRSPDDMEFQNGYERDSIREVSPEMASDVCLSTDGFFKSGHSAIGDRDSFETSNSTLRNGLSGYTSSDKYSAYLSENLCHKPQHLSLSSSAENGGLQSYQADFGGTGDKFGLKSWLEDTDKHVEVDSARKCCTADLSSTIKANILENLSIYAPEIDSPSLGRESEAFNLSADLTGDYDSHVRSLLLGYLSAPVVSDPPSPISRTPQNKKAKQEFVSESNLLGQNNTSQMNVHNMSSQHIMHPGITSALLGTALQLQGKQRTRGTGTYFPQMIVNCTEKPSNGWERNEGLGNRSHFQNYGNRNGLYRSDSLEYRNNETLAPQVHQWQRKPDLGNQPSCSVDDHLKQINRYSSASCKIEFGSVGNLVEEVLLGSANVRASTPLGSSPRTHGPNAEISPQRAAAGNNKTIHLKNEEEFPPLCQ